MTALPFPNDSFDCVYATESLEHAIVIDTAVAEMCARDEAPAAAS